MPGQENLHPPCTHAQRTLGPPKSSRPERRIEPPSLSGSDAAWHIHDEPQIIWSHWWLTITIVTYYNYYMLLLSISDMKVLIYSFRQQLVRSRHMRVKPPTAQHHASLAWLCCPTERQRSASTGFAVVRLPLPPPAPWPAPNIWAYPFFWVLRNFRTKQFCWTPLLLVSVRSSCLFCVCVQAAFTACLIL